MLGEKGFEQSKLQGKNEHNQNRVMHESVCKADYGNKKLEMNSHYMYLCSKI